MSARSERHRWKRSWSGSDVPALLQRGKILFWEPHVLWNDWILLRGGTDTSADRATPEQCFSGKEGVDVERSVLALWLGKSGDERH